MKYIFTIFFFSLNIVLYAQYNGYLGKKFFLHYTTNGSFNDSSSPYNFILNSNKYFHHYFIRHHLNIEYLQGRTQSIMGGIGIYRLGFGFEQNGSQSSSYNIRGIDFIFHKKYYTKTSGAISPFGNYVFIGGGVSYNQLTLEQNLPITTDPEIEDLGNLIRPVLYLGFGKHKVLVGNLLYSLGIECGLVAPIKESDFDKETIEGRAYRRIANNHLLKVKFGITLPSF